jgi:hypothetical protein
MTKPTLKHAWRAALVVTATAFLAIAPASAQRVGPGGPGGLVAASPDLQPIPSRITHGVVSVRNTGVAASGPSIATVNCHLPNQRGGCPEIPERLVAAYENPAYPNRVAVNIPAIEPGHVHSHTLTFWSALDWPSGTYVFDFVVDAGGTVGESNEGNNAGSYTWVVP